jgi:spore maturation protein CgeB
VNYLTDDPFNPAHQASWFLDELPEYDRVFSTRHANMSDLQNAGCKYIT